MPPELPSDLLRTFDRVEARSWSTYYAAATPAVCEGLGAGCEWISGALATALAGIDILAYNRVIGLGLDAPVIPDTIDALVDFYRTRGSARCFVQIHPHAVPDTAGEMLAAHGFRHHNNWVKLCRRIDSPPRGDTPLRVDEIGREHAATFAGIITKSFEHPPDLEPLLAGAVGQPGYRAYLAFDGDEAIAAASLYVNGDVAQLAFAGTLPDRRGRGAQGALIARRLTDAHDAGCEWMIAETAEDRPEHRVQSLRNLTQLGFRPAYLRPNYLLDLNAA